MDEAKDQSLEYQADEAKSAALPGKTLWLVIGINALVSTLISLLVVLIVGPWVFGGALRGLPIGGQDATQAPAVVGTPLDQLAAAEETPPLPAVPTATPEPILYVVEVGDSLSGISAKFGAPIEDIMEANGFDDPDYLQAGQTLLIPIGGLAEATPTFTPIPIPTDTVIPFNPPGNDVTPPASDISLTPTPTPSPIPSATAPPLDEIAMEITNVLGYGQLEDEVVIIYNQGPGVNLSGWTLSGSALGDYAFPNLFLWNGGSVRVHSKTGSNTPSDLYWDQDAPRWFSGNVVTLKNAQGEEIASYAIP